LTLAVLVLVLAGGAPNQNPPAEAGMREPSSATRYQEPTVKRDEPGFLTGVITDIEDGRILVEEDPDAGCRRDRAPVGPCSEKMWFAIEKSTRVLREGGGDRSAKPTDLKGGQRVIGDYSGYAVMGSYPSQTSARTITILGSS
jgi:hypothetical protein